MGWDGKDVSDPLPGTYPIISGLVEIPPEEQQGEPVCAVCGLTEGASVSEVERRRIGYHPFEAAPSTDEGEARWARENGIPSVWRKRWMGYSETVEIPISLEAAIRAPLEERIRELETEVSSWSTQVETSEEEAERLREALRLWSERMQESLEGRAVINDEAGDYGCEGCWAESSLGNLRFSERKRARADIEHKEDCPVMATERALANPPSSTEGTDTAADEGGEE